MLSGKYQLLQYSCHWLCEMFKIECEQHLQDRERELVEGARLSRGESGVHSGGEGVRGRQQGPLW